jgi:hypothetical protein
MGNLHDTNEIISSDTSLLILDALKQTCVMIVVGTSISLWTHLSIPLSTERSILPQLISTNEHLI